MLGYHFFEGLLGFVSIGLGRKVVGMVEGSNSDFLLHLYGENGIALFKFFIPLIVGIGIRKGEVIFYAGASSKDYVSSLPVDRGIMAFEPVVSEVYVPCSEIGYGQVNLLMVVADGETKLDKLGNLASRILGPIGIVDRDGDLHLPGI